jgi:hypothetical protein
MRIRRSEKTLDPNPFINLLSEACELASVHLFADELSQPFSEPGFLDGAGWNGDNDLLFLFLNFVTDQDVPRKKAQSLDETF